MPKTTKSPRRKPRIDSSTKLRHAKSRRSKRMSETLHRDPMQEFANRIVAELEYEIIALTR